MVARGDEGERRCVVVTISRSRSGNGSAATGTLPCPSRQAQERKGLRSEVIAASSVAVQDVRAVQLARVCVCDFPTSPVAFPWLLALPFFLPFLGSRQHSGPKRLGTARPQLIQYARSGLATASAAAQPSTRPRSHFPGRINDPTHVRKRAANIMLSSHADTALTYLPIPQAQGQRTWSDEAGPILLIHRYRCRQQTRIVRCLHSRPS